MTQRIMRLSEYLSGVNFDKYDATLPNGGKITAHHGRDKSTEHLYRNMTPGQFLISYRMKDGRYFHGQISHDVIVQVTETV